MPVCRDKIRAAQNYDKRKRNRGKYHVTPYQPADQRTPALAVKILEKQQGWNDGRQLDKSVDERPEPLWLTEGHLELGGVHEQSQAVWAGE